MEFIAQEVMTFILTDSVLVESPTTCPRLLVWDPLIMAGVLKS